MKMNDFCTKGLALEVMNLRIKFLLIGCIFLKYKNHTNDVKNKNEVKNLMLQLLAIITTISSN